MTYSSRPSYKKQLKFPEELEFSSFEKSCLNRLESATKELRAKIQADPKLSELFCEQNFWARRAGKLCHAASANNPGFLISVSMRQLRNEANTKLVFEHLSRDFEKSLKCPQKFRAWLFNCRSYSLNTVTTAFRSTDVGVNGPGSSISFYFAPPDLIEIQIEYLRRSILRSEFGPATSAAFSQAIFLNIHPFMDGNGRVGRLLFNSVLNMGPGSIQLFIPLSTICFFSKGGYEIRLRDVEENGNWLSLINYLYEACAMAANYDINATKSKLTEPNLANKFENATSAKSSGDLLSRLTRSIEMTPREGPLMHSLAMGYSMAAIVASEENYNFDEGNINDYIKSCLSNSAALLEEQSLNASLYKGVTGLGMAMQLAPKSALPEGGESFLVELDEILENQYRITKNPDIDLINGLGGVLAYALVRQRNGTASHLADGLRELAFTYMQNWVKNPCESRNKQAKDLGLAHGTPGLALIMVGIYGPSLSKSEIQIIDSAMEILWRSAIHVEVDTVLFPSFVDSPAPSRLAWCYGALGLSLLFEKVGAIIDRWSLETPKLIKGIVSQYDSQLHGINDASLCHGYSGLSLITMLHSRSQHLASNLKPDLLRISKESMDIALDMEKPGPRFLSVAGNKNNFHNSLLEGAAGVALVARAQKLIGIRPWMVVIGVS